MYRQGQTCRTIVYRLICTNTADWAIRLIGLPKELANMAMLGENKGIRAWQLHFVQSRLNVMCAVTTMKGDEIDSREGSVFLEEVWADVDARALVDRKGKAVALHRPPLALSSVDPDPTLTRAMAQALARNVSLVETEDTAMARWTPTLVVAKFDQRLREIADEEFDSNCVVWTLPILPPSAMTPAGRQDAAKLVSFMSNVEPLPRQAPSRLAFMSSVATLPTELVAGSLPSSPAQLRPLADTNTAPRSPDAPLLPSENVQEQVADMDNFAQTPQPEYEDDDSWLQAVEGSGAPLSPTSGGDAPALAASDKADSTPVTPLAQRTRRGAAAAAGKATGSPLKRKADAEAMDEQPSGSSGRGRGVRNEPGPSDRKRFRRNYNSDGDGEEGDDSDSDDETPLPRNMARVKPTAQPKGRKKRQKGR